MEKYYNENLCWWLKDNFLDVPTDCLQRDERMGWTGDAQVFSATASYLKDIYAFYAKYLYDMAKEQSALCFPAAHTKLGMAPAGYIGVHRSLRIPCMQKSK